MEKSSAKPFAEEVKSGDRMRALIALRDKLADTLDTYGLEGSEISSLSLRLTRVLAEIDELGGNGDEESDDLAARRQAKLSAAATS